MQCLYGCTPFFCDNRQATKQRILVSILRLVLLQCSKHLGPQTLAEIPT